MKKNASDNIPSFQFYPNDWLFDINLRTCSIAARGLWIDLICIMYRTPKTGYLVSKSGQKVVNFDAKMIQKLTGIETKKVSKLIQELIDKNVLKIDENGLYYSKRIVKQQELSEIRKEAGKKGGNPKLLNQSSKQTDEQKTTPSSSTSSSSSFSSSFIKDILSFWNEKNIIQHRESDAISDAIKSALKTYTAEEIKESITNYSEILNSSNHWLNHKWTLITFLTQKQKNSIETFLDVNNPLERYRETTKISKDRQRQINNYKVCFGGDT